MPEKDAPVHEAIKVVIGTTRRGRKKVIAMVQRVHPYFSSIKIRRVYEKGGFALYVKPTRKRAKTPANPAYIPMKENMEWGIDFMHDSLESGRQIRAFNIIDPFNRVCKGMFINHSMRESRVIDLLQRAIDVHGKAAAIRSDNGPEFISKKFQ